MDISKFNLGVKGVQVRGVPMLSVCGGRERGPVGRSWYLSGKPPTNRLGMFGFASLCFGWGNDAFPGKHLNTTFKLLSVTLKQGQH